MNSRTLVTAAVAAALLAACASAPMKPLGAAEARSKLTLLQADPNLATRAPMAIKEADTAVRIAEQPQRDQELASHRVYIADRKVDIARAQAETRYAEDQRPVLSAQREKARLDARTREVDVARGQALDARADSFEQKLAADRARGETRIATDQATAARADSAEQRDLADRARGDTRIATDQATAARADSAEQRVMADRARGDADAAQLAAARSESQTREVQAELDALQATVSDRGWVVTLGDVLFTTGKADLRSGATGHLDKLAVFLKKYPDRSVAIEGHTDNVGSSDSNQGLSQRRADAVRSYLSAQGVGATRLTSDGKGESAPVAENDSATGRQQNRRVEVIISNPPVAAR
jgi:outer membrane protein OmpA-like peptidoglycan-associated protein